jgi:hypothetical protein
LAYKRVNFNIRPLPRTIEQNQRYKNPDNDPRGLVVVTDSDGIMDSIDVVKQTTKKCKIYVFAPGAYPHTSRRYEEELTRKEFARIELCALPDANYRPIRQFLLRVDRKGRRRNLLRIR